MQLEIDCVSYDCEQCNPRTIVMNSPYWADKLVVTSRFTEKYAGFRRFHEDGPTQFIYVDVNAADGTITFSSDEGNVTLEMLEDWFAGNLDAILSIGYEALQPYERDGG
jgi:hypothetical protein